MSIFCSKSGCLTLIVSRRLPENGDVDGDGSRGFESLSNDVCSSWSISYHQYAKKKRCGICGTVSMLVMGFSGTFSHPRPPNQKFGTAIHPDTYFSNAGATHGESSACNCFLCANVTGFMGNFAHMLPYCPAQNPSDQQPLTHNEKLMIKGYKHTPRSPL